MPQRFARNSPLTAQILVWQKNTTLLNPEQCVDKTNKTDQCCWICFAINAQYTIHNTPYPRDSATFRLRFRVDNYSYRQHCVRNMYHSDNVSMYVDSHGVGCWTSEGRSAIHLLWPVIVTVVIRLCLAIKNALPYTLVSSCFRHQGSERKLTIHVERHVDLLGWAAVADRTRSSARRGSCTIYMSNVL